MEEIHVKLLRRVSKSERERREWTREREREKVSTHQQMVKAITMATNDGGKEKEKQRER